MRRGLSMARILSLTPENLYNENRMNKPETLYNRIGGREPVWNGSTG
jgi:hypothetical protein